MKKLVFIAAVAAIGLSACQKTAEVYYSCDPTIDGIIKQNLPYYQGMTRDEWKTLPDSLKGAALVAMEPELKQKFWDGKLNEMMYSSLFTLSEKRHIAKLYNYLADIDDFFTEKYTNDSVRVRKVYDFYKEWAICGVDSLNWNVVDIILIAEDPEELTEDYVEQVRQKAQGYYDKLTPAGDGDNDPNCNCQYNIGCGVFTGYCDKKKKCEGVRDCGLRGNDVCSGLCDEPTTSAGNNNGNVNLAQKYMNMTPRELVGEMFRQKLEE